MTTFQDPPLQSRRSVRQNERDQSQRLRRRSARHARSPTADLHHAGPRPVPDYDGPSFRARRTPEPVTRPTSRSSRRIPARPPRDFSPEGRRAAPQLGPQYGGVSPTATSSTRRRLAAQWRLLRPPTRIRRTHRTRRRAHHHPVGPRLRGVIEHTLTRRELRALRDAHGITAVTRETASRPAAARCRPPRRFRMRSRAHGTPLARRPRVSIRHWPSSISSPPDVRLPLPDGPSRPRGRVPRAAGRR
jgi:hypothetical protein